ncbi:MAG: exopolysaccharide biosynthesis polyprenyl glycosylphosphotransferase [Bryobacteraceae bacterium]
MIRLFKVSIPSSAVALVLSEAGLLFCCYLLAAWLVLDVPLEVFLFEQGGYWHIAFVMGIIMAGLYFNDLYENYRVGSRIRLIQQFCLVLGLLFLLQSALSYAGWGVLLPKWTMVYGSLLVLIVLPLWRIFFTTMLLKSLGGQKLLFLGSSPAMHDIIAHISERPELGLAVLGYLDDAEDAGTDAPRLGSIAQLDEVIAERHPARIVISTEQPPQGLPVERLLNLRLGGLEIEEASATYEAIFRRVSTRDLPPPQLIFSNEMSPRVTNVALQSAYSLLLAVMALVIALPVMAVVALIVKFISPGPVIYRQQCAGRNGALFSLYKFRSMQPGAPITTVGKWLRKLRLDELPELFNVVRGEMSIVGPRPERQEFVAVLEERIPYYRQRLSVKPGITGWAQINQRDHDKIEDSIEKLEYDRYYIKNLSISLDAYIIFHTLKATLLGGR